MEPQKLELIDLRKVKNEIYNPNQLGIHKSSSEQPDQQIIERYLLEGDVFLKSLNGSYSVVYQSKDGDIYAIRDWIGEMPLHYMIIGHKVYFANFVEDLVGIDGYAYEKIFAVNRSEVVKIDRGGNIDKHIYINFNKHSNNADYNKLDRVAEDINRRLAESTKMRTTAISNKKRAILLSGGIDSMSIAYLVSRIDTSVTAYTLQIGDTESTDVKRSKIIAKKFNITHKVIKVSQEEAVRYIRRSVADSEIFHLYNVFCALGMSILADAIAKDNIEYLFTGEGGNECFGDYYDWIIKDRATQQDIILQTTDKTFETPAGREAYIWGNLASEKVGRYNQQLGSGLGKHGGSRMYKPMYKKKITLISPYLDIDIMKILSNIPTDILQKVGGKSGFMSMVFKNEIGNGQIPSDFFNVKKTRLQDMSEDNSSESITETLLKSGYDQDKVIAIFNDIFTSDIKSRPHLKKTTLYGFKKDKK
jgi:asparagine synthetase B (glutamine-hydrolysing)